MGSNLLKTLIENELTENAMREASLPLAYDNETEPQQHAHHSTLIDSALPALCEWSANGKRGVLVTLISREGSSPRPIGAEMAVSEAGEIVGHIAVDCLGEAIKAEAFRVLAEGQNRLIRFGKGSPYIDLKLPCGSGIDLYFDGSFRTPQLASISSLFKKRSPFAIKRAITPYARSPHIPPIEIAPYSPAHPTGLFKTAVDKTAEVANFTRNYLPAPRLLIAGTGPGPRELANLAHQQGLKVTLLSPEENTTNVLEKPGITPAPWHRAREIIETIVDPYTAAALLFHDHDKELDLLPALLAKSPFYIGVMGSRNTHQLRLAALKELGLDEASLARIKGPAGLIPLAKNPALLALSLYAEILAEAQANEMIC